MRGVMMWDIFDKNKHGEKVLAINAIVRIVFDCSGDQNFGWDVIERSLIFFMKDISATFAENQTNPWKNCSAGY